MSNTTAEIGDKQIILHNDERTPEAFVVDLLSSVFGKTEAEARAFTTAISQDSEAVCAVHPSTIADILLAKAEERIRSAGHPLRVTSAVLPNSGGSRCGFCGNEAATDHPHFRGHAALICDACVQTAATHLLETVRRKTFDYAYEAIGWHFAGLAQEEIVTTTRQFPGHMRADVQLAIDELFPASPIRFFGVHEPHRYETLTFSRLMQDGRDAASLVAAQFQDVDIGEDEPVRCLKNGLWLRREGDLRFVVVLSAHREYGESAGTCVEIAVPVGEAGAAFVQRSFKALETAVDRANSYRGKVLSFEGEADYHGRAKGLTVHRLPAVQREAVILPDVTLQLLDRNVLGFVNSRERLRQLGQSTRKGVLLYGPPGTGKTHTIRYLASNLPGHTTLIITAGQMGLLPQYMTLARLLQPALVVIEDVDLIARSREMIRGCEEPLLNALLNEMDGLKEDADIIFVLTTNRPEQLEAALAGRPGRIDQAIEVPLPDQIGREKLVRLYGAGLDLPDALVSEAVARTKGVSAAFIKELMRRTAQSSLTRGSHGAVISEDIIEALNDMLFSGGRLNVVLLGGAANETDEAVDG
ncbi:ATP-dependent Clp protease adaptor ClpS [Taklimakanibacter lacteus]|uniref:ATP-dependent Clp protease adaptor ClpS n=1 Tax=Taklimakanibacter lacteus TaxID=2268456 RepID=UPI000E66E928